MDDVGDLVRLWGAKKLTEDNQPRYREDIKIDPSTVEIRFVSEEGKAWSEVTYEDGYAWVEIQGRGVGKAVYATYIEPNLFDFVKVMKEILALGVGLTRQDT